MKRLPRALSLALLVAFLIAVAAPGAGWTKSGFSSGGYSRPSAASSRTPSTRPFSAPRIPSTSGGYSRPGRASSSTPAVSPEGSATDRALARQSSREALESFRARTPSTGTVQDHAPRPTPAGTTISPRRPSVWNDRIRWSNVGGTRTSAGHQSTQFGPWSAALLWGLLESLSHPGHAEFFYHHAEDPGYRQWRAEAEAQARDDPLIQERLDELDARTAAMQGPRDPSYPAPVVETGFPYAALLTAIFLILVAVLVLYLIWRRFFGDVATRRSGRSGVSMRQAYRPQWFRIGMTLPVDPSAFILAAPWTHVQAPEAATGSGLFPVEGLGEAVSREVTWYRLYVSGGRGFFQVHLDARGDPDECRYFSRLDEVAPADANEWGFWLDDREGMIGWPEFQTRDGQTYRRLWAQGQERVAPRAIEETLEETGGQRRQRQQAMLYARSTGAPAPAPPTEYLLVCAVEQENAAWVAIHAGIDIPSGALQLS